MPTCTTDGYTVYRCSCGDSYNGDKTSAYGHNIVKKADGDIYWVTTKEATLEQTGERYCYCSRCDYRETETLPKLTLYTLTDEDIEFICTKFIELLNEERAKVGAPALSTAPIAHEMAMVRAEELTVLFSHQRPNSIEGIGSDSATIYYEYKYNPDSKGRYVETNTQTYMPFSSSEDIAYNSTNSVAALSGTGGAAHMFIGQFARSAGHWADLMNPEYTGVGVGVAIVKTGEGKSSSDAVCEEYKMYICVMTMDKTYG